MNVKSKNVNDRTDIMPDALINDSENPLITELRARKGWVRMPDGWRIVPVKMDGRTFEWFLSQGKDFSQQMETALRNYADAQREQQLT